jgi:hypothetical protein
MEIASNLKGKLSQLNSFDPGILQEEYEEAQRA